AETGDSDTAAVDYARAKFLRKGVDLLVVNDVSDDRAFGHDHTVVQIIGSRSGEAAIGEEFHRTKDHVSQKVVAALADLLTDVESTRSEEHTSELQSRFDLVCRLLLEKKNT